jgi:hypothetical protein
MRKCGLWVVVLMVLLASLNGCFIMDWIAGVDENGNDKPGDSPGGLIGTVVNYAIPGGGAVIGLLTTAWAALRGRKWRTAFETTAKVIEAIPEAGKAVADLKAELAVAHSAAGVRGIVQKVVEKL